MRRPTKRVVAVSDVAAALVTGSGIAYAYWTAPGTGTGTGTTTSGAGSNTITFTQNPDGSGNATALSSMYPGDPEQPLTVKLTNTSTTQKVYVSGVTAYLTVTQSSSAPSGSSCDSTDFLIKQSGATSGSPAPGSAATAVALHWSATELAASRNASTSGDTIQFNDKPDTNQDGCKGATVTVHYATN